MSKLNAMMTLRVKNNAAETGTTTYTAKRVSLNLFMFTVSYSCVFSILLNHSPH